MAREPDAGRRPVEVHDEREHSQRSVACSAVKGCHRCGVDVKSNDVAAELGGKHRVCAPATPGVEHSRGSKLTKQPTDNGLPLPRASSDVDGGRLPSRLHIDLLDCSAHLAEELS